MKISLPTEEIEQSHLEKKDEISKEITEEKRPSRVVSYINPEKKLIAELRVKGLLYIPADLSKCRFTGDRPSSAAVFSSSSPPKLNKIFLYC